MYAEFFIILPVAPSYSGKAQSVALAGQTTSQEPLHPVALTIGFSGSVLSTVMLVPAIIDCTPPVHHPVIVTTVALLLGSSDTVAPTKFRLLLCAFTTPLP